MRLLRETPPLTATLGRCEIEYAAALVLYALHRLGRAWTEPVSARELGHVLSAAVGAGQEPLRSWARNPFLRPDWDALVERGFAIREDGPEGHVLTLTPTALERVAAHLDPEACRRCSECQGQEHHWLAATPECPEDGEPYIPCKHCSARAAVCERCFEAPVFPRLSDQPLCFDCRLEGA